MPKSRFLCRLLIFMCAFVLVALSQTETAVISGRVTDPSGSIVKDADISLANIDTNATTRVTTNDRGIYVLANVSPGTYRITVESSGFRRIVETGLVVHVQDTISRNYSLVVGSASETVTVLADQLNINTQDATVSTVVDRQFAENLPMNGRSFQTLIQLTPGVVLTTSNGNDNGQFSVNGQRAASNYWMVDGVSANIGIGVNQNAAPGNGLGGAVGSFSALGGTNSLVSVDAMQEFRIQTSTFAPEFGRTPGGQISIITRSGTNQVHGTLFDYFRNDVLDANNWFADFADLSKPKERQNDFGGTFSGPLVKNRTFFFFSYEGLRLRLPQTALTTVPDAAARQNALPAMQPFLNAFPLPNGSDDPAGGTAQFNASFSNPATLDAYSLRVDHKITDKLTLFGRYNYSPSESDARGGLFTLNTVFPLRVRTQTATFGTTWMISSTIVNDLRVNYSRTDTSGNYQMDNFGGAVPLTSFPFPSPFTSQNSLFGLLIIGLQQGNFNVGHYDRNLLRQMNIVDSLSLQKGSHSLKFGIDFRRLSPQLSPFGYDSGAVFPDVPSATSGSLLLATIYDSLGATLLFRNIGVYAQDTWRVTPRLTTTYGLRWDLDFVPQSLNGPNLPAVTGFNLNNLSNLALAPAGTAPYKYSYGNIAPRVGLAYQISVSPNWQSVLRGGFGVFYDLATSEAGNSVDVYGYPFGGTKVIFGGQFPLDPASLAPTPITPANVAPPFGSTYAADPNLKLPYTLQWNFAVEQSLGGRQTLSASYIGSAGRRLLQTAVIFAPNPNFGSVQLLTNAGTSNYNALQIRLQRQLSRGLQALASYTWSHSIDTGSAGSAAVTSNLLLPSAVSANRGSSDFDIRQALSAGVTYDVPFPKINALTSVVLGGWSVENIVQAHTAPPVDITDVKFFEFNGGISADTRPDLVLGQSLYLFGTQYPGGKAINPNAFQDPPIDPNTSNPLRQGTTPRNFLRGFGAIQWDFAAHRDFPPRESLKLQFRAEMFNVLNHPSFGSPNGSFGTGGFGLSTQTLGQSLVGAGGVGAGAFNPLYQIGGPRSIQLALKLSF